MDNSTHLYNAKQHMMRPLNVVLLIVLAGVLGLNWLIWRDPSERNSEVLPEMLNSPAYKAQAENTAIGGGNASLKPVAGTIARGYLPAHYDVAKGKPEITSVEGKDADAKAEEARSIDRGAVVFGNFCIVCHGASGLGDGTVAKLGFPPPPSFFAENATKIDDKKMFEIITGGQENMPGYAAQVPRADRWDAIAYIRSLQKKEREAAQAAAASAAANSQAPKEVQ